MVRLERVGRMESRECIVCRVDAVILEAKRVPRMIFHRSLERREEPLYTNREPRDEECDDKNITISDDTRQATHLRDSVK